MNLISRRKERARRYTIVPLLTRVKCALENDSCLGRDFPGGGRGLGRSSAGVSSVAAPAGPGRRSIGPTATTSCSKTGAEQNGTSPQKKMGADQGAFERGEVHC